MDDQDASASWLSPLEGLEAQTSQRPQRPEEQGFVRLWRGFMTARILIAVVLLVLQGFLFGIGQPIQHWLLWLCGAYLASAILFRLLGTAMPPGQTFDVQWVLSIGIDLLLFSALEMMQSGGINYTPLYALPILLAAVLGSILLALGTAAGVALLLLLDAWWATIQFPGDTPSRFLQAGLTGTGFFIVAFLANQLATRLAREEQRALRSQIAARSQVQVNELVIESLTDGVLVVDGRGIVRAANPAARRLLGTTASNPGAAFDLSADAGWLTLVELANLTFDQQNGQTADLAIAHPGEGPRRVHASTRLTATGSGAQSLCVMFLQDLREMEARLRTEKLAAMGRMSSAVAHEIRNPLAAITQANALLEEDLSDAGHKRLTLMIRQNARRLAQIVDEILDLSRVKNQTVPSLPTLLALDDNVAQICQDWSRQTATTRLSVQLQAPDADAPFDADHLRRLLVNLLDNAARYAGQRTDSIQVITRELSSGQACLMVWSDGPVLERSVQRHLFEPFFSSESRSTGLGLYICRELCERHGAVIGYQRATREQSDRSIEGNEFFVLFQDQESVRRPAAFADPALN